MSHPHSSPAQWRWKIYEYLAASIGAWIGFRFPWPI